MKRHRAEGRYLLFTKQNWLRCESQLMLAAFSEALAGNTNDADTVRRFERARMQLANELATLVRRKQDTKKGLMKRAHA